MKRSKFCNQRFVLIYVCCVDEYTSRKTKERKFTKFGFFIQIENTELHFPPQKMKVFGNYTFVLDLYDSAGKKVIFSKTRAKN